MATIPVQLVPLAGFCIKTSCVESGIYNVPATNDGPGASIHVARDLKVFANLCFDQHVPPPPEGSEDVIRAAMTGDVDMGRENGDWFIPVVVSHARQDKDKAGKKCLVFDCVFHPSVKSRALKDPEFKAFLIELALQRIEEKASIPLSRTIGTPNIRSKGVLTPRTALIPPMLYPPGDPWRAAFDTQQTAPTIRKIVEVVTPATAPKSILKKVPSPSPLKITSELIEQPAFTWSRDDKVTRLTFEVPKLTREYVSSTTLDIEARRIILCVPSLYELDVDLSLPDSDLKYTLSTSAVGTINALQALALKRGRDFDVDGAKAEWRVAEGVLAVSL